MSDRPQDDEEALLTTKEREVVRCALRTVFGQEPGIRDTMLVHRWRGGPLAGRPKVPVATQAMIERGFMRLVDKGELLGARLSFTEEGIDAIRRTAKRDSRFLARSSYARALSELGLADGD